MWALTAVRQKKIHTCRTYKNGGICVDPIAQVQVRSTWEGWRGANRYNPVTPTQRCDYCVISLSYDAVLTLTL